MSATFVLVVAGDWSGDSGWTRMKALLLSQIKINDSILFFVLLNSSIIMGVQHLTFKVLSFITKKLLP